MTRVGAAFLGTLTAGAVAACDLSSSTGYIEIKAVPPSLAVPLYIDSVRLDPLRNGNALVRQKVGVSKLQTDGESGYLALLCTVEVKKNRITSITLTGTSRQPRCQCGRTGSPDAAANRACIG